MVVSKYFFAAGRSMSAQSCSKFTRASERSVSSLMLSAQLTAVSGLISPMNMSMFATAFAPSSKSGPRALLLIQLAAATGSSLTQFCKAWPSIERRSPSDGNWDRNWVNATGSACAQPPTIPCKA